MPLMDEFREERESIKNGTFKQKLQYFRDYYQWPLIAGIVVAAILISLVYQIITAKSPALYVALFNCAAYEDHPSLPDDFIEYARIDPKKYTINLDSNNFFSVNGTDQNSYTTIQKLTTYIGAGAIDIMAGGGEEFQYYANTALLRDLRTVLSAEQTARYEPYFYYVDWAVIRNEDGTFKTPEELSELGIPDPKDPDAMEQPVPVGIYVDTCQKLFERYGFSHAEDGIALGVCTNGSNLQTALLFIDYLFE